MTNQRSQAVIEIADLAQEVTVAGGGFLWLNARYQIAKDVVALLDDPNSALWQYVDSLSRAND